MSYYNLISLMPKTSAVDPDAQAFITAAAITDPTQQSAINQLVLDLKGYNIWSKMKAIYPFVGGTSTTHKWNLKDPRDLDAAFRLQFFGGWTHSSNGAQSNGSNAYADTFYIPSVNGLLDSAHLSCYSRTDLGLTGYQVDMGAYSGGNSHWIMYSYGSVASLGINGSYFNEPAFNPTNGLLLGQRINSSELNFFHKNNKTSKSDVSTSQPSSKIYIGARNDGSPVLYSTKEYAFASIGIHMDDTEANNFYNIIQNFQTSLSRNV